MRWPFGRRHEDLDDEIRSHLAMAAADRVERGETPDEAHRRARKEFGNVGLVTQVTREQGRWAFADQLTQDVRHSWRRLWGRPATTCLAVAMLGLAIGITTAMFTLVDALVLRPFPFKDGERIAPIYMRSKHGGRWAVAPSVFRAWKESGAFESAEAVDMDEVVLDTAGGPTARALAYVSPGLFDMLGVRPIRGRVFDASEGRAGAQDRIVISEDIWRGVFNADPDIAGRRVTLGRESVTIVGVLPRDFRFPGWRTQLWRPLNFVGEPSDSRRLPMVFVKWSATVPAADALRMATTISHTADPETTGLWADADDPVRGGYAGEQYVNAALRLLAGGVVLVFLVLCTSVSSLLLTRFNARRRDVALSWALGASRARVLWQASVENVTLGVMGAAVGVVLTFWLVSIIASVLPDTVVARSLNPLNVDARALGVATGLAVVATLVAGVLPAWMGTRGTPLQSVLTRTTTESKGARVLSRAFLVTEVALACALLVGATLLVRSFVNLSRLNPGFNPTGILSLWSEVDRTIAKDAPARWAVVNAATTALTSLPGVTRVVRSSGVPLFAAWGTHWNDLEPTDSEGVRIENAEFQSYNVGPEWFELFGVRVVSGRTFGANEDERHLILGARLASTLWPNTDAVGRWLRWDKDTYQIVGVAEDLRSPVKDLERDFTEIYVPLPASSTGGTISLRCDAGCPSEGLVRQRLSVAAPALLVHRVAHLETLYREELSQPRAMAMLGVLFGAIALVVSAGGLFSVLSHTVGCRRREFGIRLVLGSTPADIRRLVLREGLVTAGAGIAFGALGGWMATRALTTVLYGVIATDALSWSAVIGTVLAASLAGAWRPAVRAAEIDPGALLREE
jgi:predicted permease